MIVTYSNIMLIAVFTSYFIIDDEGKVIINILYATKNY